MMDPRSQLVATKPLVIWSLMSAWHLSENVVGLKMVIGIMNLSGLPFLELCLERELVFH